MLKKLTLLTAVFAMLVMLASPAYAILRVLEPELSDELKAIAKEHTASSRNIDAAALTIDDAWLREFFNVKVDVYMIEATIDKNLSTEQKIQIPVRVDTKTVLSEADFAMLAEEDNALAPEEPVMRIMSVGDEPVSSDNQNALTPEERKLAEAGGQTANLGEIAESRPIATDGAIVAYTAAASDNTLFYIAGAILAAAVLAGGYTVIRRKA